MFVEYSLVGPFPTGSVKLPKDRRRKLGARAWDLIVVGKRRATANSTAKKAESANARSERRGMICRSAPRNIDRTSRYLNSALALVGLGCVDMHQGRTSRLRSVIRASAFPWASASKALVFDSDSSGLGLAICGSAHCNFGDLACDTARLDRIRTVASSHLTAINLALSTRDLQSSGPNASSKLVMRAVRASSNTYAGMCVAALATHSLWYHTPRAK
jgi:hypothetical protein